MTERLMLSRSYIVPGALIAGLALQVSAALAGVFTTLRSKAAEQGLPVPPLVRIYFRATMRTLFVALAILLGASLAAGQTLTTAIGAGFGFGPGAQRESHGWRA